MSTTCSLIRVWRNVRAAGDGGSARQRPPTEPGPDAVIRQICRGGPMSVAELHRAAAVLDRHVGSGRMDVYAARLRIAIRLEDLTG